MASNDPSGEPSEQGRVAQLITDAFVNARERLRGVEHAAGDARLMRWLDAHEDEFAPVIKSFLGDYMAHPDLSQPTKDLMTRIMEPEHGTGLMLLAGAAAAIVMPMIGAAIGPVVREVEQTANRVDQNAILTPGDLINAEFLLYQTSFDKVKEMNESGFDQAHIDVLRNAWGSSVSMGQLIEARRRDILSEQQWFEGLVRNGLRWDWIDVQDKLIQQLPDMAQVIMGVVEAQITDAEGQALAQKHGYSLYDFDWLVRTYGRPPGIAQLLKLRNRKLVDDNYVTQAIKESNIKTKYAPDILKMRQYVPPVRTIPGLYRHGAITRAQGLDLLDQNGVTPQDAAAYLDAASNVKTVTQKELSGAQITSMHAEGWIDRGTAVTRLTNLHYDTADANLLLDVAEDRARHAEITSAVTGVKVRYLSHYINLTTASNELDALGVPATAKQRYLSLWQVELTQEVKALSITQIQHALKLGGIQLAEFINRATAMGYKSTDMRILAYGAYAKPTDVPPEVQALP